MARTTKRIEQPLDRDLAQASTNPIPLTSWATDAEPWGLEVGVVRAGLYWIGDVYRGGTQTKDAYDIDYLLGHVGVEEVAAGMIAMATSAPW